MVPCCKHQWCWIIWTFGNHQVNIQNQAIQVRPIQFYKFNTDGQVQIIKFYNINTDDQGGQFPPDDAPPLSYFYDNRSSSCTVNLSHLTQTTSSRKFFPLFWKIGGGTNSWRWETNTVKYRYIWQESSSILYSYVFGLSFISPTAYEGRKMKNPMWLCMAGEVMSIFLYG